ncbi:Glutathione hydrolase 1 proenzyme [Halotydeus destructor]|nr:Glutathione hydrolase 1 proenzyme [Halotydeus destructor]
MKQPVSFLLLTIVVNVATASYPGGCDSYLGCYNNSTSRLGVYQTASVVSDALYCAPMGKRILQDGGSAADAAVTTVICMGLVNPHSSGLGGGGFITYYNSTSQKATVINAREMAPSAATEDMFHGNANLSETGGQAVAVPAELAGLWELHQRFGQLPWSRLFREPIELASKGFRVGGHLARALQREQVSIRKYNLEHVFINPETGRVYEEGQLLVRPDLAFTFEQLAAYGADYLYSGPLADILAQELSEYDGIITADDIKSYKPIVYDALEMDIENTDLRMFGTRPPGSGAILGFMLNVMAGYGDLFPQAKYSEEGSALYYHRLVETFKFAYARRMFMGDERFDDVTEVMANLTSQEFADTIRSRIVDGRTFIDPAHYDLVNWTSPDRGTAHMNVIDAWGNAVAMTTTVNDYFGSKIMSPSTGIVFNNQMDDFSSPNITNSFNVPPSRYNRIVPGKRPFSSMAPSVFIDTKSMRPVMIIGGEGGTQITSSVAAIVLRTILFGDDIKTSIDAPRIHDQLLPNTTMYEANFPDSLVSNLAARGHLMQLEKPSSETCAIHIQDGRINANADYRKVGSIDGY